MTIDKRMPSPMKGGNARKISGPSGSDPRSTIANGPKSAPNQGKGAPVSQSVPGRSARGK